MINEHGLVGVLKSLHDELDAAVLQAYGWADLTLPADTDALLLRLVKLNARRAAQEGLGGQSRQPALWLAAQGGDRPGPGRQSPNPAAG